MRSYIALSERVPCCMWTLRHRSLIIAVWMNRSSNDALQVCIHHSVMLVWVECSFIGRRGKAARDVRPSTHLVRILRMYKHMTYESWSLSIRQLMHSKQEPNCWKYTVWLDYIHQHWCNKAPEGTVRLRFGLAFFSAWPAQIDRWWIRLCMSKVWVIPMPTGFAMWEDTMSIGMVQVSQDRIR